MSKFILMYKFKDITTLDGTRTHNFELEVQRADPLRHEGTPQANDSVPNELFYRKNFTAS